MTLRIVLAGGGTAGHVNPLLATAKVLKDRGHSILVVGTEEGLEKDLVPAAGFDLVTIPKVPFPRRPGLEALRFPTKFHRAYRKSARVLQKADVALGFGGYVGAPVYLAARNAGVPLVIHEQNARPGWANKLGARFAKVVALTFPGTPLKAAKGRTLVVGMPLRAPIAKVAQIRTDAKDSWDLRCVAAQHFDLNPHQPTLLVTGGSLGAQHLNEVLTDSMDLFGAQTQVIHITGKGKSDQVNAALAGTQVAWLVKEYEDQMELAFAASDLVVARSGAGMVSEIGALGLPAIFVPLPFGNGEQALNAKDVAQAGGAEIVSNKEFSRETIKDLVVPLLNDPQKLSAMGKAAYGACPADGAARLADLVEESA